MTNSVSCARGVARGLVASICVFAALGGAAHAQDASESDAQKIRRLAASPSDAAAVNLGRIVRFNPRPELRIEAARGFATCPAPSSGRQLATSVARGGPDIVRAALAQSLAQRGDGLAAWEKAFTREETDSLGRVQLVRALGAFVGPESRAALLRCVHHGDPAARAAAIAVIARRKDTRTFLVPLLEISLEQRSDIDTVTAALDVAADLPADDIDGLLSRLRGELLKHPLAVYLKKLSSYQRALADFERKKGTPYALPRAPDKPSPPNAPKVDLVFALDYTVSESLYMPHYLDEVRRIAEGVRSAGNDVRVSIVGYRDELKDQNQRTKWWTTRATPLSHDFDRAIGWGAALKVGGVGDRKAAIFAALEVAVARMNWRPGAARQVSIFTFTDVDQASKTLTLVKTHRKLDGVRVQVRVRAGGTRTKSLKAIAAAGGTEIGAFKAPQRVPRSGASSRPSK